MAASKDDPAKKATRRAWIVAGSLAAAGLAGWFLWSQVLSPSARRRGSWSKTGSYLRRRKKLIYKPK